MIFRRGSRINTDQLPKGAPKVQTSGGSGGMLPQDIFFLGFRVIQTGYFRKCY